MSKYRISIFRNVRQCERYEVETGVDLEAMLGLPDGNEEVTKLIDENVLCDADIISSERVECDLDNEMLNVTIDDVERDEESEEFGRFLHQNDAFTTTLSEADGLSEHAEHHAGGHFVLCRYVDLATDLRGGFYVKTHDSWDGPDDEGRPIVVHLYDPDDSERFVVLYVRTGDAAVDLFLNDNSLIEIWKGATR